MPSELYAIRPGKIRLGPERVVLASVLTKRLALEFASPQESGKRLTRNFFRGGVLRTVDTARRRISNPGPVFLEGRDWLKAVLQAAAGSRSAWVIVPHLVEGLACTPFFHYLDCGQLQWRCQAEEGSSPRSGQKKAKSWAGVMLLNGPPAIITTRDPLSGQCLRWLDLRNFLPGGFTDLERSPAACRGAFKSSLALELRPDPWLDWTLQALVDWFFRVSRLLEKFNLGGWQPTIACQAWQAWRSAALPRPLEVKIDPELAQVEQRAVVGGLCRVFRKGVISQESVQIDLNSFYPWLLGHTLLPFRRQTEWITFRRPDLAELPVARHCLAEVTLETSAPSWPLRKEEKVLYPTGRFRTFLCGTELAEAQHAGALKAIHGYARYELADHLAPWASLCAEIKSDPAVAHCKSAQRWLKRLVNSLTGKFAQRARRWVDAPGWEDLPRWYSWLHYDPDLAEILHYRRVAGQTQIDQEVTPPPWSFPAITAWLQAAGRHYLRKLIRAAGAQNIWYCDTDSVIGSAQIAPRLRAEGYIFGSEPGQLRIECEAPRVAIWGPKRYQIGEKTVWSGRLLGVGLARAPWTFSDPDPPEEYLLRGALPDQAKLPACRVDPGRLFHSDCAGSNGWVVPPFIWEEEPCITK